MNADHSEYLLAPKYDKYLYFEKFDFFIFLLAFFILAIKTTIFILLGLWVAVLMLLFALVFVAYMTLFHAPYKRAKFIRNGGRYRIKPGRVEVLSSNGAISTWNVTYMNCKVRPKRKGRVDISFGKNLFDFIKHYGSKEAFGFVVYGIDHRDVSNMLERLELKGKVKGWAGGK
ncbi:hypothetical protein [Gynuella sunshinyii]|uniref:hypothetical protein n=1 Tax=Gynuella sunshinyii TaxID=1445505 RepID=UPI0005CBE268|nr:hypothetical protein [Gynuella sunshinyii]